MSSKKSFKETFYISKDSSTNREKDVNGYLKVKDMPITKEQVRYYYGYELSDLRDDLDPDKKYGIYCPASVLKSKETIKSFCGVPIKDNHVTTTADDPRPMTTVGAMMNDVHFDGTYLRGSAVFYSGKAIRKIEDNSQRELSAEYFNTTMPEEGSFNGDKYIGKYTSIKANHVALVPKGRAGRDVKVSDAMPDSDIDFIVRKTSDEDKNKIKGTKNGLDFPQGYPKEFGAAISIIQAFCPDIGGDTARSAFTELLNKLNGKSVNKNVSDSIGDKKVSDKEEELKKNDDKSCSKKEDKEVEDKKSDEDASKFLEDMKEKMKGKSITPDECIKHCKEYARKLSSDKKSDSKEEKEDDKKEDKSCSKKDDKKVEDKKSDADIDYIVARKVSDALPRYQKALEQRFEARQAVKPLLGETNFTDASSTYKAGLEKFGVASDSLEGVPLKALKTMFNKVNVLSNNNTSHTLVSDSSPEDEDILKNINAILPR